MLMKEQNLTKPSFQVVSRRSVLLLAAGSHAPSPFVLSSVSSGDAMRKGLHSFLKSSLFLLSGSFFSFSWPGCGLDYQDLLLCV